MPDPLVDLPSDLPIPKKMLSPFEWTLVDVAWSLEGEAPLNLGIHRQVSEEHPINYNAVTSILERIETKGWAVIDRSQNRKHRFRPLFTRDQAARIEIEDFLARLVNRHPEAGAAMLRERLASLEAP